MLKYIKARYFESHGGVNPFSNKFWKYWEQGASNYVFLIFIPFLNWFVCVLPSPSPQYLLNLSWIINYWSHYKSFKMSKFLKNWLNLDSLDNVSLSSLFRKTENQFPEVWRRLGLGQQLGFHSSNHPEVKQVRLT